MRQLNNRNGGVKIESNVPTHAPDFFQTKPKEGSKRLLVQNFDDDVFTGRRRLVGLSELDVSRDVMDFKFITNSDQESEPIEYFLEMKKWDSNGIDVQVQYTNPLQVGKGNDNIATALKNTALFAPASGAKAMSKAEATNVASAPPQVPKGVNEEDLKQDAATACKALVAILVAMVIIQIWVKGNFRDFWGLFFILQFICYCHFYDTPLPGNAEIYIQEITKMIELQLINPDDIIRAFNPDFNKAVTAIDQDAHVSVWNDVKLYLFLIVVFAIVVLGMLIASLVKAVRSSLKEGLSIIKTKFVWDYSIQFCFMAYLKLCMSVMNQIDLSNRNSYYWRATDSDGAVVIGILLLLAPVAATCFLYRSDDLDDEEVRGKYQNLYSDVALFRNKFSKFYSIAFALRRIVFISIPVMFSDPMIQIVVFMIFHSLYLAAYVGVKPHVDCKRAGVEVFNEVILMVFMYHLAGWNGLIADLQMQFDMGYSFIFIVLLTLCVNTGLIVYRTVENWRHRRQVELNRLLVLEQFEKLKTAEMGEGDK